MCARDGLFVGCVGLMGDLLFWCVVSLNDEGSTYLKQRNMFYVRDDFLFHNYRFFLSKLCDANFKLYS